MNQMYKISIVISLFNALSIQYLAISMEKEKMKKEMMINLTQLVYVCLELIVKLFIGTNRNTVCMNENNNKRRLLERKPESSNQ